VRRTAVLFLASLLLATPSWAAKKKSAPPSKGARRYGVVATGPSATASTKAAVTALKAVQVPENRLQEEAQRYGAQLGTDGAYQALAVAMNLHAILRISTFDKPDGAVAVVQVRDGATGKVVDDATWKAPNTKALGQTLTKQLKSRFGRSLGTTRAPPPGTLPPPTAAAGGVAAVAAAPVASARAPAAPAPPTSPDAAGSDNPPLPTGVAPPLPTTANPLADPGVVGSDKPTESIVHRESERPALDIAIGAGILHRSFSYKDDLFGVLQGYSLGAAITPAAELTWAPLFGGRMGITGHFSMSVGLKSQTSDGTTYPTQAMAWGAGIFYRFFLGEKSHLGIVARYESQSFSISADSSGNRPDIPDVKYSAIAGGLDLRLSLFGPVSLLAGASYRYLLSVGEIGTAPWFPRQTSMGVDAMLGFGIELGSAFEIRIEGQLQRYGFSFNPEPGDPKIAGGATDTYLSGIGLFAFRF
jgi:hypothetical protein